MIFHDEIGAWSEHPHVDAEPNAKGITMVYWIFDS